MLYIYVSETEGQSFSTLTSPQTDRCYPTYLGHPNETMTLITGVYGFGLNHHLGCDARKPVLGVSDQVIPKINLLSYRDLLDTETALLASFDMILYNKQITKALIRLRRLVCAFVVCNHRRQVFSRQGPLHSKLSTVQSLYNNPGYNTDLDIMGSLCGSHYFFTMELLFLYNMIHFTSIPMSPKHSFVRGLHGSNFQN